jgi:hypothetical protein
VNTLQSDIKRFLNLSSWDISLSEELENGGISGENHLRHTVKLLDTNSSYL